MEVITMDLIQSSQTSRFGYLSKNMFTGHYQQRLNIWGKNSQILLDRFRGSVHKLKVVKLFKTLVNNLDSDKLRTLTKFFVTDLNKASSGSTIIKYKDQMPAVFKNLDESILFGLVSKYCLDLLFELKNGKLEPSLIPRLIQKEYPFVLPDNPDISFSEKMLQYLVSPHITKQKKDVDEI